MKVFSTNDTLSKAAMYPDGHDKKQKTGTRIVPVWVLIFRAAI